MAVSKVGTIVGGLSGIASGVAQNFGSGTRKGGDSWFNVEKFKSELNTGYGLFKPTLFYVTFGVPKFTLDMVQDETQRQVREQHDKYGSDPTNAVERLSFLCSSASLPGVQIITSDYRRQNMGTFDRRPFGVQVTDIPLTFMLDGRGFVLKYFNQWANAIVNADLRMGERGESVVQGQGLYEIGYRDSYIADITITTLTGAAEPGSNEEKIPVEMITYKLHEAFPIQIGDVSVAWNAENQFSTLPVQFTFRSYSIDQLATGRVTSSRDFSMAEWLGLLGTSFNIGSQIFKDGLPNTIGDAVNLFGTGYGFYKYGRNQIKRL